MPCLYSSYSFDLAARYGQWGWKILSTFKKLSTFYPSKPRFMSSSSGKDCIHLHLNTTCINIIKDLRLRWLRHVLHLLPQTLKWRKQITRSSYKYYKLEDRLLLPDSKLLNIIHMKMLEIKMRNEKFATRKITRLYTWND